MLFLLNNPILIIIGIFLFGLLGWVSYLIVREIQFNRVLREKHRIMRVESQEKKTTFNRRLGLLGGTALAPIFVLVLVFVFGSQGTISPTGDTEMLSGSNDIELIYSQFQDYLSGYEGPTSKSGEMEDGLEDSDNQDIDYGDVPLFSDELDGLFPASDERIGWDEGDNTISDDIYVYQMMDSVVNISLYNSPAYSFEELPEYKEISMVNEQLCDTNYTFDSIYVDSKYLSIAVNYESSLCGVELFVYNKDSDFILDNRYQLSGEIVAVKQNEGSLVVVTSSVIDYESGFDTSKLPFYRIDDVEEEVLYEDILYYDATYPYAFTSIYFVDLVDKSIDMEVLLGDFNSYLYITENNLYLVGYLYYFDGLAELFDLESPVDTIHSIIVKFNVESDVSLVAYSEVDGVMLEEMAIREYDEYLVLATTSALTEEVVNHFYVLDDQLNIVSKLSDIGMANQHVNHVRFYETEAYVYFTVTEDTFQIVDLEDIENPKIK